MNFWLENSKKNLLPLSIATEFSNALWEWSFTGNVIDYEDDEEIICQLCEHPELAHHYEIKNKHNDNLLLVGSSCILKFQEIEVRDASGAIVADQEERRFWLREALRKTLREDALNPLRELWKIDIPNRLRIEWNARTLKRGEGVSPRELLFLFRRMQAINVSFQTKLYKISLKALHERGELARMSKDELDLLKPAMSAQQLKRFAHLFGEERTKR